MSDNYVTIWGFSNPTFNAPPIRAIKEQWSNIKNDNIVNIMCSEEQYLEFQKFIISNLVTASGKLPISEKNVSKPVGFSIRAGMVKSMILTAATIIEAGLRYHAHARGYVSEKEKSVTLGRLRDIWKSKGSTDISHLYDTLDVLTDRRNTIHAYKAEEFRLGNDYERYWKGIVIEENLIFNKAELMIAEIKKIKS
ncbi:hypothetical protein [Azospirillum sp. TSH64]|uniref:hypothetical protein n=1 Tax=Azospirillum sp. TSH64 TaxID=652740 RepID=UPI0011B1DAA9|nr:hypothetical protein [Azospirillum sp. TSH64]